MKPLEGVKILDFSQFLSAPFCTMILADMGAEVIKMENPPAGDVTRWSPPGRDGFSTYYASVNRGKKSVIMNLKDPKQKELFLKMVRDADAVVENYKPGTMEKFGCGHEELLKINPKLVYTAVSGYGQNGPWSRRAALDLVIQAASGMMSITGEKGGAPQKVGVSICDILSGLYAAIGTVTALFNAQRTGKGTYVDIAMMDATLSVLESPVAKYLLDGRIPVPVGNRHVAAAPFQPFNVKDGGQVFICIVSDEQWEKLCDLLGKPEWKEIERFSTVPLRTDNVDEIAELVQNEVIKYTAAEFCDMLEEAKLVYGQINNIKQAVEHPQTQARRMIVDVHCPGDVTLQTTGSPINMDCFDRTMEYDAVQIGSGTFDILSEYASQEELHAIYDAILPDIEAVIEKKSLR